MPSDARIRHALDAVRRRRDTHRSALVAAVEELRGVLAARGEARETGPDARLAREMGPFASGRIDAGALATILRTEDALSPETETILERAVELMAERADAPDEAFVFRVPEGEDLRDAVRDALADAGAVFGASRAAEEARAGIAQASPASLGRARPFRRWTRGERQVAPPVVLEVAGEDLRPAGLADFMDGNQAVVLVVRGPAPPAALARLVTPAVLVAQTTDPEELGLVAQRTGPAVVALFDEDAEGVVPFVHDPEAGPDPRSRIRLAADRKELRERLEEGRFREPGWAQDLAVLLALTVPPAPSTAAAAEAVEEEAAARSVDRLAGWLLAQSDLAGLEKEA